MWYIMWSRSCRMLSLLFSRVITNSTLAGMMSLTAISPMFL